MTFPDSSLALPWVLLLMRAMVGALFITSGRSHITKTKARAESIGMSVAFTRFLGIVEFAGGLGVVFGVLTQLAAFGLILVMGGAIYKKIAVWHTGFWGEKSSGWHYDLMIILMNLVIIVTNGGPLVLLK